jgi:hypothetical protein
LPKLFQPVVAEHFEVLDVRDVNHRPHPFMIGNKHFRSDSVYLDPRAAPCAMRGCGQPYDSHTYDVVCFLQCKHNVPNADAVRVLRQLEPLFTEHKIDGMVFVKHPQGYVIEPAIGSDDAATARD